MPTTVGILSGAGSLKNPAEPQSLGYRVNYISNPSFEADTSGWGAVAGATLERVTTQSNTGSAALKVTNAGSSGFQTSSRIAFLGGQGTYFVSAYIKLDTGAGSAGYYLRHLQYESLTSSGAVSSGNVGLTNLSFTGNWVRISGSFSRNASADYVIIRIATTSTVVGEVYFVDSIMLEKSNALGTYFDGSSNGFWTGTPNSSFSGASPYT